MQDMCPLYRYHIESIAMQAVENGVPDADARRSTMALWQKTAQDAAVLENGSSGAAAAIADTPLVHSQWSGNSNLKAAATLSSSHSTGFDRSLHGASDGLGPRALHASASAGAVMESLPNLARQSAPVIRRGGFTFEDVVKIAQERHMKALKGRVSVTGVAHVPCQINIYPLVVYFEYPLPTSQ